MQKEDDSQQKVHQQQAKQKSKFQMLNEMIDQQTRKIWESEQLKVRKLVVEKDDFKWDIDTLKLIAGVDLSADKDNPDKACVGLVIYNCEQQKLQYEDCQTITINQPYIPGFLAFRQVPSLYELFERLKKRAPELWPDLLLVDGNGILHPNQCGLGCHLGVLINTPTIGVGKTFFSIDGLDKKIVKQECQKQIKKQRDYKILIGESGRKWGAALRMTNQSKNPVFVSVGHRISIQTAIKCVLKVSKFRVPQPIRLADKKTRQIIEKATKDKLQEFKKYNMVYL